MPSAGSSGARIHSHTVMTAPRTTVITAPRITYGLRPPPSRGLRCLGRFGVFRGLDCARLSPVRVMTGGANAGGPAAPAGAGAGGACCRVHGVGGGCMLTGACGGAEYGTVETGGALPWGPLSAGADPSS